MQLYYSQTSPFARKVAMLLHFTVICEYLDDLWCLDGNLSLIARGSQHYYLQQKAQAQANGVIEAAVNAALEKRRETEQVK